MPIELSVSAINWQYMASDQIALSQRLALESGSRRSRERSPGIDIPPFEAGPTDHESATETRTASGYA
jgi:hypothetical protein